MVLIYFHVAQIILIFFLEILSEVFQTQIWV